MNVTLTTASVIAIPGTMAIQGLLRQCFQPLLNFEWVDQAESRAGEARRSAPLARRGPPIRLRARARQSLAAPGSRARPAARTAPPLGGGDRGGGNQGKPLSRPLLSTGSVQATHSLFNRACFQFDRPVGRATGGNNRGRGCRGVAVAALAGKSSIGACKGCVTHGGQQFVAAAIEQGLFIRETHRPSATCSCCSWMRHSGPTGWRRPC
jgi:hypothetical protein